MWDLISLNCIQLHSIANLYVEGMQQVHNYDLVIVVSEYE